MFTFDKVIGLLPLLNFPRVEADVLMECLVRVMKNFLKEQ